jgi:predicted dithiol-disulfide oxidoreductase (DUF899 family)
MKLQEMESKTKTKQTDHPEVVSAEWLVARKDLLTREKEFARQRNALSAVRRQLQMGLGSPARRVRCLTGARAI